MEHSSDVDSQDNRKVSCLMAAFRKVGREGEKEGREGGRLGS